MRLLDVAGGTGDIAFRFLDQLKFAKQPVTTTTNDEKDNADKPKSNETKITVCDINANMLSFGKKRAIELNYADAIRWQVGNAEKLVTEADNSYDVYTIAFGIRNCTNLANVVREAHRVLRPGGVFMCLEFSHAQSNAFKSLYDFYSFEVIPVMGYLIAGDWKSYQYLVESIRVFPKQVYQILMYAFYAPQVGLFKCIATLFICLNTRMSLLSWYPTVVSVKSRTEI